MKRILFTMLFFSFTTFMFAQNYCIPVFTTTNTSDGPITYVSLTGNTGQNINNSSGLGTTSQGYSNFTNQVVKVQKDYNNDYKINFSVTVAYVHGYYVVIWIDLNNDGIFQDSEKMYHSSTTLKTHTGQLVFNQNSICGDYLRIRILDYYYQFDWNTGDGPCMSTHYGEAEDYTINAVGGSTFTTPTGNATQTFNAGQTLANLVVNGSNLVWYSNSATLPTTTALVDGTTYYVAEVVGNCKSSALAITVNLNCSSVVSTPTGNATQTFNAGQTIADLVVNGSNLVWYSNSALTTTLPTTTALVDGTTSSVVGDQTYTFTPTQCANAHQITISVVANPSTPTGNATQTFTAGQTIADLDVNGSNLVWYSDEFFTDMLSDSDLLVAGTYYVVSQVGNCQSDPLIINVTETVNRLDFDLYGFSYYPNPTNDILHLSSNQPIENVIVSTILGQQVNVSLSSDNKNLDLSNLANGNYFVKVTIEGVSKTIKVIKQ